MPDAQTQNRKAQRDQLMRRLLVVSDGSPRAAFNPAELGAHLGFDETVIRNVVERLVNDGLIVLAAGHVTAPLRQIQVRPSPA